MSHKSILNPGTYHGTRQHPPFFEGWYFKMVSADEHHKLAIIPGVILGTEQHAFIQVIDGSDSSTEYANFAIEDFQPVFPEFNFHIGDNTFNARRIHLAVYQPECQISGDIQLGELTPWPVSLFSPGVMGPFAWIPGMETYHGVLSLNHILQGQLVLNGKAMDFTGGYGCIEKDWGKSFPSGWVWMQSNHFSRPATCLTASVAIVPWMGFSFRGFIVGLWVDEKLYRFTTYAGGRIERLKISETTVDWVLRNRTHRLFITAQRAEGGSLKGPTPLDMGKRVVETLNASVRVRLETLKGELIFDDTGEHTGLEVSGEVERLVTKNHETSP